ncbi:MAG TPA: LacI family DNA-binding transcriptional regulator [Verrucomicrobiae bacterium]|nr:LacI family DNA-binding transcriptional regulator [Verrucomicrobiae bacterium]
MSVTLQHIADEVGLSTMTVSRALRGVSRINPETRRRVRDAAQRLGYQPISGVMFPPSVRGGKGDHNLRILLPTIARRIGADGGAWWLDRMTRAMQTRIRLSNGRLVEQHFEGIDGLLLECERSRCHGVVLRQPLPQKWVERLLKITAVVYGVEFDHQVGVDSVYSNEHRSAAMVLDYLRQRGHNHIAWLGILDRHSPYQVIFTALDETSVSDRQAFTVHGARHAAWANIVYCQLSKEQQRLVLVERDWRTQDLDSTVERGLDLIRGMRPRPTAIVCSCDPIALSLIKLLRERCLDVPGDVSLLSYGGSEDMRTVAPSITSVEMPMEIIGRVIPELIERRLADPQAVPISVQFETTLREGASICALNGQKVTGRKNRSGLNRAAVG